MPTAGTSGAFVPSEVVRRTTGDSMTRCARHFSAAAVVAGFGLTAVIARAADFQNNSPLKWGSGVVLVSASDEAPTGASESPPARLDDPRGVVRSADSPSAHGNLPAKEGRRQKTDGETGPKAGHNGREFIRRPGCGGKGSAADIRPAASGAAGPDGNASPGGRSPRFAFDGAFHGRRQA